MLNVLFRNARPALAATVVAAGAATFVFAADPVGPKLTERLKGLLAEEMSKVSDATGKIAVAIAAGDHATVKALGEKVRDSFILKQSLTPEDKKDLMGAVPKSFLALDKQFHATAGKLAEAADAGDTELQRSYFGQMLQSCTQCHADYASDRFTGFAK